MKACLLLLLLAGCTNLAPLYERASPPVAETWPTGPAYAAPGEGAVRMDWQDFIADRRLQSLIELALANNRDLRMTASNLEKVQAQYQIESAALYPHLNANAGETASLTPAGLSPGGRRAVIHAWSAGLGLSAFELDFFGRIRNLQDAALEQYLASVEAHQSLQISLVAEVAATYLRLAANQSHLQLATATLKNQQAAYALEQRRYELGASSMLSLSQAQTTVDAARGDAARYSGLVAQDINALNLLAGTTVAADLLPPDAVDSLPVLHPLSAGLPSDLLQNRPDIMAAEHQLKAAHANIGAARAAFFPSISLTGSYGVSSNQLSSLFDAGSTSWLFMPQLKLPIFDGGSNRANLKGAQANREIALAQYEKTIQTAFREVADALANQGTLGEQLTAQQSLVDATARNLKLSEARFGQGIDSYLPVLDSERALYAAKHNLISLKLAEAGNRVTLYKALGGGNMQRADSAPPAAPLR